MNIVKEITKLVTVYYKKLTKQYNINKEIINIFIYDVRQFYVYLDEFYYIATSIGGVSFFVVLMWSPLFH